MDKRAVRSGLSSALIFTVLAAAIGAAGYRYYSVQKSVLLAAMEDGVSAIASGKVSAVLQWHHERLADALVIAAQARQYRDSWSNLAAGRFRPSPALRSWLESFGSPRYHDVSVMNGAGDEIFPRAERAGGASPAVRDALRTAMSSGLPVLSRLHEIPGRHDPHADLVIPVYGRSAHAAGALVLYMEAERSLASLLKPWPLTFQSIESAIVQDGHPDKLYFGATAEGKARLISIPASEPDPPLRSQGPYQFTDYRGRDVIAVTMPIPETDWLLMTKVDAVEIRRHVAFRENVTTIIIVLLVIIAGLAAAFNWRNRASLLYRDLFEAELRGRALTGHYGYLSRYSNDLILLADDKGLIIETNERCESALGMRRSDLVGCEVRSLVSDSWLESFDQGRMRAQEQDGAIFESELKRTHGRALPVEISARAIWVDGREFSQAIVRDITERKQAEEDWRAILKTTTDGFCVLDAGACLLDVNEPYREIAGGPRSELIGFRVTDTNPAQGLTDLPEHVARIREKGADRWETWFKRPDGRLYDLEISAQFLPGNRRVFAFVRDITANKQALRELEQSQRMVSRIVQHTPNLLYIFEVRQHRYNFVNPAFEDFFGWSRPDLDRTGSKVPARLIDPGDLARMSASQKALSDMPEGAVSVIEFRALRADGEWRRMRSREVVFSRSDDGKVSEVLGIAEDITEQVRATEELRHANELLAATFNASPLAMLVNNLDGTVLRWNAAAEETFGWKEAEVLGRLVPFIPPGRIDEFRNNVAQVADGTQIRGADVVRQRRDGSPVDLSLWTAPIRGISGDVAAIVAVIMDVSEQKRARAELEKSQASLMRAHRMASLGSWTADLVTGAAEWSDEAYRILGCQKDTVKPGWDAYISLVHPEDRARVEQIRIAALAALQPYRCDHRIVRSDGKIRHIRQSAEVTSSDAGSPLQISGTIQDITEYKILEEQLWQSQKLETVGRLAGGIAHDFNNLLTVINGYSEVLLRKTGGDPFLQKGLSEIFGAGERAAELTKNLLAFSRKQVFQTKAVDLNATVQNMQSMLKRLIGEDVELETELAPALVIVMADPIQLQQIILNIAVNARDAMPRGGTLRIETENVYRAEELPEPPSKFSPHVLLKITDTGTGMTPEVRSHLFEPFFTTKEPGKGTGLGLSTVYGIVKQSGGMIAVDSSAGLGTTFRIYFPAAHAVPAETKTPQFESIPPAPATVLVSEDQDDVRRLMASMLRELGYQAIEASGGEAAAAIVERSKGAIDLVITDIMMPGMTGFDLARILHRTRPGLPVIFVSGFANPLKPEEDAPAEWGDRFIAKPFTRDALARKIEEVLRGPAAAVRS
jgi:two-component system cell cycle sensor histidine kinase/response regulator CckA